MKDNRSSEFKDVILTDVGEVVISNTQKYRVLIVLDNDTRKRTVSAQKWWRENKEDEWTAGKGFKLDHAKGTALANLILEACSKL